MMKKKFFTYCCLFLALISCKRQVVIQHDSMVVLHAAYAQTPTKVGLDSDLKTIWTDGDRVSVFYAGETENSNAVFTGKTGSRSGEIQFSVPDIKLEGNTYAAIPYRESNSLNGSVLHLSVPAVQTYTASTYDPKSVLMVASTPVDDLQFRYACAVVCLEVRPNGVLPVDVKSITLSAAGGENIAGAVAVDMSNPEQPRCSMEGKGCSSIEMRSGTSVMCTIPSGTSERFYFCVAPAALSQGYSFDVQLSNGSHVISRNTAARSLEEATLTVTRCGITSQKSIILDFNDLSFNPALPSSTTYTTEDGSKFSFTNPSDGKNYSICAYSLESGFRKQTVDGYLCLRFNGVGDCLQLPAIPGMKLTRFGAMVRQQSSKAMRLSSTRSDAGDIVPAVTYRNAEMTYSVANGRIDSPLYLYMPSNNTQISRIELYFE